MEPRLRTELSAGLLLLQDRHRNCSILLATLWSSQAPYLPADPVAGRDAHAGLGQEWDSAERTPYVLPALMFFWFASFAWGLWYIAHTV
jgi:hypothetical protein